MKVVNCGDVVLVKPLIADMGGPLVEQAVLPGASRASTRVGRHVTRLKS